MLVRRNGRLLSTTPYSVRFVVAKDAERAEVKVKDGIDGFPFQRGEEYIFKYSFKPKEGMQVGKLFTILGQLKGDTGEEMIKGVPIYSIVANDDGIMVRFSNLDSIDDHYKGLDDFLSWEDALGKWVHVKVTTVLGESREVRDPRREDHDSWNRGWTLVYIRKSQCRLSGRVRGRGLRMAQNHRHGPKGPCSHG